MSGRKFIYTKDKLNYIREKIKLYKEKIYLRSYENIWTSCRDVACRVSMAAQNRPKNGFLPAVGMTMVAYGWASYGLKSRTFITAGHRPTDGMYMDTSCRDVACRVSTTTIRNSKININHNIIKKNFIIWQ
jgi:hypothetical protein